MTRDIEYGLARVPSIPDRWSDRWAGVGGIQLIGREAAEEYARKLDACIRELHDRKTKK